jgi:CheY-like chemotaxis protein
VDDEESVRAVGAQMAEKIGMKAVLAESGERALEILARSADSIDVVLLDLMMPRLSGAETLARLRTRFPDLPVVLSSGFEGQAAATAADPAGVSGFLEKPYLLEELEAALTNALDRTTDDASRHD